MTRHFTWAALCLLPGILTTTAVLASPFTNVTSEANISHYYYATGNGPLHIVGGAVAEDFNGDGWIDLYALQGPSHTNLLYINQHDGTFVDEAVARGADISQACAGVSAADFDNDGDIDIAVTKLYASASTNSSSEVLVLVNDGTGAFTNQHIIDVPNINLMSTSWGDVDNDGVLELVVGAWISQGQGLFMYEYAGGQFVSSNFRTIPRLDQFVFSPRFADLDSDRLSDLIVVADFGSSQQYMNRGQAGFERVTEASGAWTDENGMGVAIGDYDNDGDLDCFVSSIFDDSGTPEGNWGVTGNRLYQNTGLGSFTDVTDLADVRDGNWGWGSAFGDMDKDGDLDLVHVNGWTSTVPGVHDKFNNQPARLFQNIGSGTFREIAAQAGTDDRGQGRGLILFDYDNDGDQDVFIVNNGILDVGPPVSTTPGAPVLLRNDVVYTNNWLKVTLAGTPPLHRNGIGSRVCIRSGELTQMRDLHASTGFLAHGPGRIAHFGIGSNQVVDEVRAEWNNGDDIVVEDVPANSAIVMQSPSATLSSRSLARGETVIASAPADGNQHEWVIQGETNSSSLATASFLTRGEKELLLNIYQAGTQMLIRQEILRLTVLPDFLIQSIDMKSSGIEVTWPGSPGYSYHVYHQSSGDTNTWIPIGQALTSSTPSLLLLSHTNLEDCAWYRIEEESMQP